MTSHSRYERDLSLPDIEPEWVSGLRKKVGHLRVAKEIFYYRQVDSTNLLARELVQQDTINGTVIISGTQTSGRGRLGREWTSPPGGIWVSLVLYPPHQQTDLSFITISASVAVARTVEKVVGLKAEIKWPNDIISEGSKVCGILCELVSGPSGWAIIVGIGMNLNVESEDLPLTETYPAGSLKVLLGRRISEERFMESFFHDFNECYSDFLKGSQGKTKLLDQWRRYANMLGKKIIVKFGEKQVEGIAKDVDEKGYLVVEGLDGTTTRVMAGDVLRIGIVED